jgi:hypothetical protein
VNLGTRQFHLSFLARTWPVFSAVLPACSCACVFRRLHDMARPLDASMLLPRTYGGMRERLVSLLDKPAVAAVKGPSVGPTVDFILEPRRFGFATLAGCFAPHAVESMQATIPFGRGCLSDRGENNNVVVCSSLPIWLILADV